MRNFDFLKNLDIFSEPVPTFNISGKTSVQTWVGTWTSIIIFMMTFAFGLLKF